MRFATPQGFPSGDQFFAYLKDSFDTLYAEGATAPKCCRSACIAGWSAAPDAPRRWRVSSTMRLATTRSGRDPARYRPPFGSASIRRRAAGSRRADAPPVRRAFGGVYEHSRWVAEAAYDAGLSGAATAPKGSPARWRRRWPGQRERQARADQGASGSRRKARDGQAADAGIRRRQASAGLDRLSADELTRFTELNEYRARFGFPFIMAVKGKTKAEISAAFEHRLGNDAATEFGARAAEIEEIAGLRLREILP